MPRWAKKEVAEKPPLEVTSKVFQVFDSKGDFVRDYSTELSGENAEDFAKVFAEELGGTVKAISTIETK